MARKNLACRTCEFRLLVFRMGKLISQKDLTQTCGFGGMTDSQAVSYQVSSLHTTYCLQSGKDSPWSFLN